MGPWARPLCRNKPCWSFQNCIPPRTDKARADLPTTTHCEKTYSIHHHTAHHNLTNQQQFGHTPLTLSHLATAQSNTQLKLIPETTRGVYPSRMAGRHAPPSPPYLPPSLANPGPPHETAQAAAGWPPRPRPGRARQTGVRPRSQCQSRRGQAASSLL